MKRVLLLSLLVLAMSGCSKDYMAEREFFQAEKVLNGISRDAGPEALEPAIAAFKAVADKFPGTDKAAESLRLISNMRIRQERYDAAIEVLDTFISSFPSRKQQVSWARNRKAQLYESLGDWEKAESLYWELSDFHNNDVHGLYAPIHIILHYAREKDVKNEKRSYAKAIDFYQGLIKSLGPIQQSVPARNYLAVAYMTQDLMQEAITEWLSIADDFPGHPFAPMGLLAAGEYLTRKNQYDRALQIYHEFLGRYEEHEQAPRAMVNLGNLYSLKQNQVEARKWYHRALGESVYENEALANQVRLLEADTFVKEGNWAEAEKIYLDLQEKFPDSNEGLQVPLLRATYYKNQGELEKMGEILDEALLRYEELKVREAAEDAAAVVKDHADRFKFAALSIMGDWNTMIGDLDEYMNRETEPEKKGRWLFLKALLTQNRLQDIEKARDLYEAFLEEYPNHPLSHRARAQLDGLGTAAA